MWYQPWTAGSVVAVVSTHGNRGLEEGKKQEEQHAKKGKMEKMEQIIYEQAFKEHCVTSNNKMKGKKHLKWVALFRRHTSSSKAMSLRKTVNLSYFFFFQDLARTITGGCKVRGTWDGENTNTNSSVDKYQNRSSGAAQRVNTWNTDYMHSNLACTKPPPTPASKSRHPPPGGGRECFSFFSSSTQCRALPSILKPLSPGHIYSWQMKRIS